MNKTEEKAYRWLQERGYAETEITFQNRESPDFLTADGKGWEVKLIRQNSITFSQLQLEVLTIHPDTTLLAFDGGDTPLLIVPFCNLTIPGYCGKYRLAAVEFRNLIRIVAYLPTEETNGVVTSELYERLRVEAFSRRKSISQLAGEYIQRGLETDSPAKNEEKVEK